MISQFIRVIEQQEEIISSQSTIIDELCQILAGQISAEDFANLDIMQKINKAVAMRTALDKMGR